MIKKLDGNDNFWYTEIIFNELEQSSFREYVKTTAENLYKGFILNSYEFQNIKNDDSVLDYCKQYNIFLGYQDQIYDLLKSIKGLLLDACNELNIDYDKEKYYIHGWIDQYSGQYNNTDVNNIVWNESSFVDNTFCGFLSLDAEPSKDYYSHSGKIFEFENKNGTLNIFKNHKHANGLWEQNKKNIKIGFNIVPVKVLLDIQNTDIPHVPMI